MMASNKAETIRSVKGMRDLLPRELYLWRRVEADVHRIFGAYNFEEVRLPILEQTSLFARTVGADTDIVSKEMFTFEEYEVPDLAALRREILGLGEVRVGNVTDSVHLEDQLRIFADRFEGALTSGKVPRTTQNQRALEVLKESPLLLNKYRTQNDPFMFDMQVTHIRRVLQQEMILGDSLALRPEATASVVRAYIEHSLYNEGGIHKLYYMGPMFRRERPQKGRYRQFYQIGAEVLGSDSPLVDAEVLEMLVQFLQQVGGVGAGEFALLINSVGCARCRPEYMMELRRALEAVEAGMCADCQRRAKTNPLRVFDCKVEVDQPIIGKLPTIFDHLDPQCRQHFDQVKSELTKRGIEYQIRPRLVRGLDYYTRTTFEITSGALGAQDAILGGGRYDGLSEMLGGPATPGIGFAIGQDRLILVVSEAAKLFTTQPEWKDYLAAYIVWLGDTALEPANRLTRELRQSGLKVAVGFEPTSVKKQLGIANRIGARFAIIVGDRELEAGRFQVKDMLSGQQQEMKPEDIPAFLKEKVPVP